MQYTGSFAGNLFNTTLLYLLSAYLETYQVRQVLGASHFAELRHGVESNTVPRHQPAGLCEEQNKLLNKVYYII